MHVSSLALWQVGSSCVCQEKYTAATFKSSRALRNKLCNFSVLKEFEDYMGQFANFVHPEMPKAETVLSTMNSHASFLDAKFCGQSREMLGAVLLEICKFCVEFSVVAVKIGRHVRYTVCIRIIFPFVNSARV